MKDTGFSKKVSYMLFEFPERVARENIAIVEILTKNFSKWKKNIKPQIQESLQSTS